MPSNIASHEGASSLGKEPLNSWSMQNIAGSTSSIGKWNKLIILIGWCSSNEGSGIVFYLRDGPTWILTSKNFKVLAFNNDIKKKQSPRYFGHFPCPWVKPLHFL